MISSSSRGAVYSTAAIHETTAAAAIAAPNCSCGNFGHCQPKDGRGLPIPARIRSFEPLGRVVVSRVPPDAGLQRRLRGEGLLAGGTGSEGAGPWP